MPPKSKSDFLTLALALAEMGFDVVPANRRHPILKGWPTAATHDPEQIRKWIPQYENAFAAIVIRADGDFWALDADVPDWLQRQWGQPLPKTATVRSGGGGLHLYFQHDAYSRAKLGPLGISFITNPDSDSEDRKLLEIYLDRHCLLAPGTLHWKTGNIYQWEKGRCIRPQPAPHEFVDFLLRLPWSSKSGSAGTDGPHALSRVACRLREDKKIEDLSALLGLKKEPAAGGFKFHSVHVEQCPAAGRKHHGNSNSVWLFFYNAATRQLRFYCSGGSCAAESKKDRTRAALEALGTKPGDWLVDESVGMIMIGSSRIHEVIEKCERALIEARDERLFRHGSELVHVTAGNEQNAERQLPGQEQTDEHPEIHRPLDVPFLVPVTRYSLHLALSRTERVFKCNDNGGVSLADPPEKWGSLIMDRLVTATDETPWPSIRFVTNSPTLLPNGDVIEAEGYHAESGIWFNKRGVEFPPIPQTPTLEQAQEAMKAFEAVYHRFDFRNPNPLQPWNVTPAYSALLSTILSVVVRNLVPTVPMLAIVAPVAGTGKTLLADTIFGATTGMKSVTVPFDNTEEFDKLLPTILRQGTRLILIDNVETTLRSARLCVALTQKGPLTYRILGETRSVQVENPSVFIATGNNLAISGDLPRRCLETRLDPNVEDPHYRKFDFDPAVRARERFPELVVAALTAIRAYMLAGCPKGSGSMDAEKFDFGSFTEWDQMIRGCLLWLGYADPLTTQEGIEDPMKGNDLQILAAWHGMWGEEEHTINEISRSDETELHEALLGGRREWDPGVVAHKLRKLRDRVIGNYKLIKTRDSTHGAKYMVAYLGRTPPPSKDSKQRAKKPKKWESKTPPREG
jgi:Bifunctional DNA primase/polymerase, N-terminal